METTNGPLRMNTVIKDGIPTQVSQYGDQQLSVPIHIDGEEVQTAMQQLLPDQQKLAHQRSTKNGETNLQQMISQGRNEGDLRQMSSKESYMMMQQDNKGADWYNDDNETNVTENGTMDIVKTQINDIMIQKDTNIDRNSIMNTLNLVKQNQQMRQTPFVDIHTMEQMNKDSQLVQDHDSLMRGERTTGMILAPRDSNPNLIVTTKFLQNSGKPIMKTPHNLPTHEEMEFTNGLDLRKESAIKQSGPFVSLPSSLQSMQQDMQRTNITHEPIVDVKNQKVILDQTLTTTPMSNGKPVLVETTVNPEIIAKVEHFEGIPVALFNQDQKIAAGQFMTILVLMKHGGFQIPQFEELATKFQEINGMKPTGMFKRFDPSVVKWANKQIDKINKNEKNLDTIIRKYQEIYSIDPKQQTANGQVQFDKNGKPAVVAKENQSLTQPFGTSKENYSNQKGGKQKWVMRVERCTVMPKNGGQKVNRVNRSEDVVV